MLSEEPILFRQYDLRSGIGESIALSADGSVVRINVTVSEQAAIAIRVLVDVSRASAGEKLSPGNRTTLVRVRR